MEVDLKRLQEERKRKGFSQEYMAKAMGNGGEGGAFGGGGGSGTVNGGAGGRGGVIIEFFIK